MAVPMLSFLFFLSFSAADPVLDAEMNALEIDQKYFMVNQFNSEVALNASSGAVVVQDDKGTPVSFFHSDGGQIKINEFDELKIQFYNENNDGTKPMWWWVDSSNKVKAGHPETYIGIFQISKADPDQQYYNLIFLKEDETDSAGAAAVMYNSHKAEKILTTRNFSSFSTLRILFKREA